MKTLYGTHANRKNIVGFCRYHRKWITKNQLAKHKCLKKECTALQKVKNGFWDEREKKKLQKKQRKGGNMTELDKTIQELRAENAKLRVQLSENWQNQKIEALEKEQIRLKVLNDALSRQIEALKTYLEVMHDEKVRGFCRRCGAPLIEGIDADSFDGDEWCEACKEEMS